MPVSTQHSQYIDFAADIKKCRDVSFGRRMVHKAGELYLPALSHSDADIREKNYQAYKKRAGFYNASGRTFEAWSGMVFRKDPISVIPPALEEIADDVTMAGDSIRAIAEKVLDEVIEASRIGLLVDFPMNNEGVLTRKQAEALNRRPHLSVYLQENIINWRFGKVNNRHQLTFVVLVEQEEMIDPKDEFKVDLKTRFRVLDLVDGVYRQRLFEQVDGKDKQIGDDIFPLMNNAFMDFIPFEIATANCDPSRFCKPPALDLVEVNLGHYLNMADLEHGAHWTAIPTPTVSGIDENMLQKDAHGKAIPVVIGGGELLMIPDPQGRASFMEFTGAGLDKLRMLAEDKKSEMATLGARMIAPEKSAVEATETHQIKRHGENATLSVIAKSISASIETVLGWLADWHGVKGEIVYQLSTDFVPVQMSSQMLTALIGAVQSGTISGETLWWNLQRGEIAQSDRLWEDELELIEEAPPPPPISPEPEVSEEEDKEAE